MHRIDRFTITLSETCRDRSSTQTPFDRDLAAARSTKRRTVRDGASNDTALLPVYDADRSLSVRPDSMCYHHHRPKVVSSYHIMRHLLASRFVNDLDPQYDSAENINVSKSNLAEIPSRLKEFKNIDRYMHSATTCYK